MPRSFRFSPQELVEQLLICALEGLTRPCVSCSGRGEREQVELYEIRTGLTIRTGADPSADYIVEFLQRHEATVGVRNRETLACEVCTGSGTYVPPHYTVLSAACTNLVLESNLFFESDDADLRAYGEAALACLRTYLVEARDEAWKDPFTARIAARNMARVLERVENPNLPIDPTIHKDFLAEVEEEVRRKTEPPAPPEGALSPEELDALGIDDV